MPDAYSTTAEDQYISDVLQKLAQDYIQLKQEIKDFKPYPLSDLNDKRKRSIALRAALNPNVPLPRIEEDVAIAITLEHSNQFSTTYSHRVMSLMVSVLFMSQALCEALINRILIVRFYDEGVSELYDRWDRASLEDKWMLAPKTFLKTYNFDKGGAIYSSLRELVAQRNAFTHYKPMIEVNGKAISGKKPARRRIEDLMDSIGRFISLPYDLAELASMLMREPSLRMMLDRKDIPLTEKHQKELKKIFVTYSKE